MVPQSKNQIEEIEKKTEKRIKRIDLFKDIINYLKKQGKTDDEIAKDDLVKHLNRYGHVYKKLT